MFYRLEKHPHAWHNGKTVQILWLYNSAEKSLKRPLKIFFIKRYRLTLFIEIISKGAIVNFQINDEQVSLQRDLSLISFRFHQFQQCEQNTHSWRAWPWRAGWRSAQTPGGLDPPPPAAAWERSRMASPPRRSLRERSGQERVELASSRINGKGAGGSEGEGGGGDVKSGNTGGGGSRCHRWEEAEEMMARTTSAGDSSLFTTQSLKKTPSTPRPKHLGRSECFG